MIPTLFLHVGIHKTGTTAIQKTLADNAKELRRRGLYRPTTGLLPADSTTWGHHALAWALREGDEHRLWKAVRLEAKGWPAVIVSSEEFSLLLTPDEYTPIVEAFDGWRIRVICYLRRQDQLLASIYNHHVKSLGETDSLMTFAAKIRHRLSYGQYLETLATTCGRDALDVRLYEKEALQGDVIDDFLAAVGVTDSSAIVKPDEILNASLSGEGLRLMLEGNRRLRGDPAGLEAFRQEVVAACEAPPFSIHDSLTEAERDALLREFEDGNRAIARKYFSRDGPLFSS